MDNNDKLEHLFACLPKLLSQKLSKQVRNRNELCEIRFRVNAPVQIIEAGRASYYLGEDEALDDYRKAMIWNAEQMEWLYSELCSFSAYAYMDEISQGFLTLQGGHRVGITGKIVWDETHIQSIQQPNALNIRVAKEHIGIAQKLFEHLIRNERCPRSVLIASPPGCGKTSLLRDLIRMFATPGEKWKGCKVGLVDERAEIAACYHGTPQNDIGIFTDVLDRCPKVEGMRMLLRSMSPNIIAADELGSQQDYRAIKECLYCGCSILATVHIEKEEDLRKKLYLQENIEGFERLILLGSIKENPFQPRIFSLPNQREIILDG